MAERAAHVVDHVFLPVPLSPLTSRSAEYEGIRVTPNDHTLQETETFAKAMEAIADKGVS